MRLCGYQPQYFPRLHYLNRVVDSDIFEVSDYVQFVKKHAYPLPDGTTKRGKSYQAHTIIKQVQGELFLAVPSHERLLPINKTVIDYSQNWAKDHLKSIEVGYRKSQNFSRFFPEIEVILTKRYDNISDLTLTTVIWGLARLITQEPLPKDALTKEGISELLKKDHPFRLKTIFLASESSVPPPEKNHTNDWCIALCKYAGADEYIYGGTSHSAYMDEDAFHKAGIKTILQDWKCQPYTQQFPKTGFLQNLSIIDLIMNEDLAKRQSIISGK